MRDDGQRRGLMADEGEDIIDKSHILEKKYFMKKNQKENVV